MSFVYRALKFSCLGRRHAFALMASLIFLISLTGDAYATKAEGPFSIDTKIDGQHATIKITTSVQVSDVTVQISGSDGLEIKDGIPKGNVKVKEIARPVLSPGEAWVEEIDFTHTEGLSYLNVIVNSRGQPGVAKAFSVGELSEKQKAERQKGVRRDPEGNYIKLMNE